MFSIVAERLTFLRALDPAEVDTLSTVVVKDFNRVAVENGDKEPVKPMACDSIADRTKRRGTNSQ